MKDNSQSLGTEKISKLLIAFSVPSVISLVLNALYNMVDQIFIGNGVGYLGNGATNVIFPLTQFAIAVGLLIGDGTSSYVNLQLGSKEYKNAEKGMAAGLMALTVAGIVLSVSLTVFLEPLCHLFGSTDAILPYALDYGTIIAAGTFFNMFSWGAMSMVRADGSPKIAMVSMLVGFVINMIGDPLTIYVFGWGVKGAAIATVTGQIMSSVICLFYFLFKSKSVHLTRSSFHRCRSYIPRVSRMGLSSFVTQLAIVLVLFFQNNLLVKYGAISKYGAEIPMTALGVTMKVFTILQYAITGLCSGAQPIISYNYGSEAYPRVKQVLKQLLIVSAGIMGVATVWFQIAPMSIVNIFGSADALYNEFSVKCLKIFLMLIVLDSFQMAGSSFLQSVGKPIQATVLVMFRQIVVQIPAMLILSGVFGIDGILYAGPVSSLLVGIMAIIFLSIEWRSLGKKHSELTFLDKSISKGFKSKVTAKGSPARGAGAGGD